MNGRDKNMGRIHIAERILESYKRLLTFPANTAGVDRKIGVFLYLLSAAISIGAILALYLGSDTYYTELSFSINQENETFLTPDLIFCPWHPEGQPTGFEFNARYNKVAMKTVGMTNDLVNKLTQMKFDACGSHSKCRWLENECPEDFSAACAVLSFIIRAYTPTSVPIEPVQPVEPIKPGETTAKKFNEIFEDSTARAVSTTTSKSRSATANPSVHTQNTSGASSTHSTWTTSDDTSILRPPTKIFIDNGFIKRMWLMNGNRTTLEMLWLFIIYPSAIATPRNFPRITKYCDYLSEPKKNDCEKLLVQIWVDKNFCWLLPSMKVARNEEEITSILVKNIWPTDAGRYTLWLGNLQSQQVFDMLSIYTDELSDFCLTYSAIELINSGGIETKFVRHENVRGLVNSISVEASLHRWYYRLGTKGVCTHEINSRITLSSVDKIQRKKALSRYGKFQVAAGFLSSCIGYSAMQTILIVVEGLQMKTSLRHGIKTILTYGSFFILVCLTVFLCYLDLSHYFENRYTSVLREERTDGLFPTIEFHVDLKETLNNKEPHWKMASAKMLDFLFGKPFESEILENMSLYFDFDFEMRNISYSLGLSPYRDPSRSELILAMLMNSNFFLSKCELATVEFPCKTFLTLSEISGHHAVIRLDLVKQFLPANAVTDLVGENRPFSSSSSIPEGALKFIISRPNWLASSTPNKSVPTKVKIFAHGNSVGATIAAKRESSHLSSKTEIAVRFKQKSTKRFENDCLLDNDAECPMMNRDLHIIFRAVQLDQWCRCVECLHGKYSLAFKEVVARITGRKVVCCTLMDLMWCFDVHTRTRRANDSNSENILKRSLVILKYFNHGIRMKYFLSLIKNSAIPENTKNVIETIIHGFQDFNVSVKSRLIHHAEKCFRPRCKQYYYFLAQENDEETNDSVSDSYHIFYKTSEIFGTEEVDRFNIADYFGVLMCGFSFTFGIGLIGIMAVFLLKLHTMQSQLGSHTQDIIRQHLMRSIALWTEPSRGKGSDEKSANETEREKEVAARESVVRDTQAKLFFPSDICIHDLEQRDPGPVDQSLEPTGHSIEMLSEPAIPPDLGKGKPRDHRKNRETSTFLDSMTVWTTESRPRHADVAVQTSATEEMKSTIWFRYLLLISLLISMAAMVRVTIEILNLSKSSEFSTDIISKPIYEAPSIILCQFDDSVLWLPDCLEEWLCQTSREIRPCSEIFSGFFRDPYYTPCFIYESPGKRMLDPRVDDVIVWSNVSNHSLCQRSWLTFGITERKPDYNSYAYSSDYFSDHCLDETGYCITLYQVQKKVRSKDCYKSASKPDLRNLTNEIIEFKLDPLPITETASVRKKCNAYNYVSFSTLAASEFGDFGRKELTVRPMYDFATVTSEKPRHNLMIIISIIGGFVGTFTELTLLNCISCIFLILRYLVDVAKHRIL